MSTIRGFGVGSRIGAGKALILKSDSANDSAIALAANKGSLGFEAELSAFESAQQRVASEYRNAQVSTEDETLSSILTAQIALLEDQELVELVKEEISRGNNSVLATERSIDGFIELLGDATGEFKERIADLQEIKTRIINSILGIEQTISIPASGAWIIVAEDLTPLETSKFTESVKGVITRKGGPTSHTAIVCRQLGIPALVGCQDISMIHQGASLVVDPVSSIAEIREGEISASNTNWWENLATVTSRSFKIFANVGSITDAKRAKELKAEGVGLLRSELALLHLKSMPSLSEQREIYKAILKELPKGEVIFRTLDAGTDKPIPFLGLEAEFNPALGVRGQRIEKIHPDFFQEQLVALREAATDLSDLEISVMAPMIATREEAIKFADQCRSIGFNSVGVMVEIPSLIDQLSNLVGHLDFISIGTNDLSQYLFAADRQNSQVAELLDPWQPALLGAIARVVNNAGGMKVGVCGEAASDPLLATVLVGLGVSTLSAGVGALSDLFEVANRITLENAHMAAEVALSAQDHKAARSAVLEFFKNLRS
jgi:phosphotransferase system enzyme I (PtsI)